EVLEQVERIRQPCIRLRLWLNRQVRREDPCHAELSPLSDRHRLATNRETIGKRGRPDIDIQAAVELVPGPAIAVAPVALAVRLQTQCSGGALRRDDQVCSAEPPCFVPGEAVAESERT